MANKDVFWNSHEELYKDMMLKSKAILMDALEEVALQREANVRIGEIMTYEEYDSLIVDVSREVFERYENMSQDDIRREMLVSSVFRSMKGIL